MLSAVVGTETHFDSSSSEAHSAAVSAHRSQYAAQNIDTGKRSSRHILKLKHPTV